ncbi:MAG: hypothetical protein ACQEWV_22005 [Bacillota bacterium]
MKRIITFIISFSLLVILALPTSAQQFEYPANQDKSFKSEDEFFQQLSKDVYKELLLIV